MSLLSRDQPDVGQTEGSFPLFTLAFASGLSNGNLELIEIWNRNRGEAGLTAASPSWWLPNLLRPRIASGLDEERWGASASIWHQASYSYEAAWYDFELVPIHQGE